jgi:hypothetical protein
MSCAESVSIGWPLWVGNGPFAALRQHVGFGSEADLVAASGEASQQMAVHLPSFEPADPPLALRSIEGLGRARRYALEDLREAAVLVGPELAAAHASLGKHTMRCDVLRSGGRQHVSNAVLVHAVLDKTK